MNRSAVLALRDNSFYVAMTQEDIDLGIRGSAWRDPMSRAIARACHLDWPGYVSVVPAPQRDGYGAVNVWAYDRFVRAQVSGFVSNWVRDFDRGRTLQPCREFSIGFGRSEAV